MRGRYRYRYGFPGMWAGPRMMMMCCGPGMRHDHDREWSDEDELEALEELQRDLEEAAADVADRIRRAKERDSEKADA